MDAENAFHFAMNNSRFVDNVFLSSNRLNYTTYVEIKNITVSNKGIDYNKYVNVKAEDKHREIVYNIPYLFRISEYHDSIVYDVTVEEITFESYMFGLINMRNTA